MKGSRITLINIKNPDNTQRSYSPSVLYSFREIVSEADKTIMQYLHICGTGDVKGYDNAVTGKKVSNTSASFSCVNKLLF